MRIEGMAKAAGVALTWQPFLLGPVFGAQGWDTSPFNIYPAKGRYMWRDMERISALRGLAFQRPKAPDMFPMNSVKAARLGLLALKTPKGPALCRAIFQAQFEQGRDISDGAVLGDCLARCDLPPTLLADSTAPEHRPALRAATGRAVALGIFGAPTFEVDGELFWGDDRLGQAFDWAQAE